MATSTVTDGLATRISILLIGSVVARIGSFQTAVYSLGVLSFCVFVLHMGIWGAWKGSLASQTVQALMCMYYTRKIDVFKE